MTERAKKLLLLYYKQSRKIRRVSGLPPLTFKAKKAGTLKNYRIYGDTVNGESVGDRTGNLFDGIIGVDNKIIGETGGTTPNNEYAISEYIPVEPNMSYTYHFYHNNIVENRKTYSITEYDRNKNIIHPMTLQHITEKRDYVIIFTTRSDTAYIRINWKKTYDEDLMLNEGSTALPYEPYGYKVPVTVEGKNLLQNTTTSRTINGVTFTVNEDGSVTCNGTASVTTWFALNTSFDIYAPDGRIVSIGNNGSTSTFYMDISYIGNITSSYNYSKNIHQNVYVQLVIAAGYTCDNLTFYPMIRKADIEDDTYEPYHAPVTTPIYLPEQIRKVGDEAEYIDYGEQKMHRIGADDIDVTLPALLVLPGTNTLTVGTEVQPSGVEIKGRIKAAGGD